MTEAAPHPEPAEFLPEGLGRRETDVIVGADGVRYVRAKDAFERERRAAEVLRRTHERLQLALDAAYVISFEWDIQRDEVRRNVLRDPALSRDDSAPDNFAAMLAWVHPDDRELFAANVRAALARPDGRYRNEFRIVHRDGQIAWLSERGLIERDAGGRALYLFGIAQDVTAQKRTEALLEARLRISTLAPEDGFEAVLRATLDEAERITGSSIGYFHFVAADQITLSLQTWSTRTLGMCTAKGAGLHYSIDEAGVWVDCLRQSRPVIHNDYAGLAQRKDLPAGHVPLTREMAVPVKRAGAVVAIVGVGNKPADYLAADVEVVSDLAQLAMERVAAIQAEQALAVSEERYRSLFENMSEGFALCEIITDGAGRPVDYRYLDVNPAFERQTGLAPGRVIGRRVLEVLPGTEAYWIETYGRVALCGESARIENYSAELGRWFNVFVYRPAPGQFAVVFNDISARKLADENLQHSRQDLQRAQAMGKIGSWRLDLRRNELTWSAQTYRIFGVIDATPMTYELFLDCVHPADRAGVDQKWQAALRGEPYDIDHRLRGDGAVKWVRERAELEFAADGTLLGAFGTTQDITDRKALEAGLVEARNEALRQTRVKTAFLANMSHEIRTPLHVMVGQSQLLRRDLGNSIHRKRIDELCASSDHLLAIVNDILDFSKIEAEHLVLDQCDFRLNDVVAQVRRMVEGKARKKGLMLATELAPALDGVWLNGDPLRLAQVLINLCDNAVKFTERGEVRLTLCCPAQTPERVSLRCAVEDSGCGIAAADRARLFEPFTQGDVSMTREYGGTGLGLAISGRLVALMGGTIEIESRLGSGSRFGFEVLLARGTPVAVSAPPPIPTSFHGTQILFADDHPQSQEIVLEMLEDLGCEADVAADGLEAVDCARVRAYDLILMDMQMPRMDGLAATRAIRALPHHRATPIIALTANAFAEDRQRCLAAGMNAHLGKPLTPDALATVLGRWLPGLDLPQETAALCDNALSRALTAIPGLEIGSAWRGSAAQIADYRAQLERFAAAHGQDMAALANRLASGERDAAQSLAHRLKGIAGLLGAKRIAALAGDLEQALRSAADADDVMKIADECAAELARLIAALGALPRSPAG